MTVRTRAWTRAAVAVSLTLAGAFASIGCDDSNNSNPPPPDFAMAQKLPDMTMPQQNVDMAGSPLPDMTAEKPDADCFDNPMTHLQIINACTASMRIAKPTNPLLPFVNGQLPPLP